MSIEGILGLLVCASIISVIFLLLYKAVGAGDAKVKSRFPPGPFAWPVTGHLHLLWNLPHQTLRDDSLKYGPIMGLRFGQQRAVVVSTPALAKQVLLTHDKAFADRPPHTFTSVLLFGSSNGIVFTRYGPEWRKHRRICQLHLFTAKRLHELQYVRQEELRALLLSINHLSCSGTRPVDVGMCVGRMSSRLVMRLLQSRATRQVGGENLQQLVSETVEQMTPTMGDLIPSLSWLDFFRKWRMRRIHARLDKVYTELLMEHQENASLHDDLLHSLLSQEEPLTAVEIKSILQDMTAAAIHTTAQTLEWVMAELLRNPHCLHRLEREIDTQLGDKQQISDEDLPKLSYLKCVVKETFRLHPAVPLLIPRMSLEECQVQGYTIQARTLMFVNVWAIGRDENVWPNANEFMPERFENSDIDLKGQHFELLPFGSGRRSCLGLPLALPVIEATLANLVSCFNWELPDGEAPTSINMDEKSGITANKATPVIALPKPRASFTKLAHNHSQE